MLFLAPDPASAAAGRKLTTPAKWPTLNAMPEALWGECQGSGSQPYLVGVDLRTPEYASKCSCPSRKFPCKHALALLLMHVGGQGGWGSAALPQPLQKWLDGRQARQEHAQSTVPKPTSEKTPDPAAKARREAARTARVSAGLSELHLWLQDLVREGLHAASTLPYKTWDTQAARLIDAQIPGAARLVSQIPERLRGESGDLLAYLGRLALLCEGWTRRGALSDPERLQLMSALGQPLDTAALLAGEGSPEEWTVLGRRQQPDGHLEVRRTWLRRTRDGQMAALLDFAPGGRGFPPPLPVLVPGQLDLRLVPTLHPQRALLAGAPQWGPGAPPTLPALSVAGVHRQYAAALALNPWVESIGCILGPVWLSPDPAQAHDLHGHMAPLSNTDVYPLLARAGGRPATLFGEWNGAALEVLSVLTEDGRTGEGLRGDEPAGSGAGA